MKSVSNAGNIIKIVSVYVGLILGAGFASGQEIIQFFAANGTDGLVGLLLTGILFSLVAAATLELIFVYKVRDSRDFSDRVYGKWIGIVIEYASVFFMWVLFAAMLSAFGAVAQEVFQIGKSIGIVIGGAICYVVFLFGIKGLISINVVLSPVLIVGGIIIGLYTYFGQEQEVFAYSFMSVFKTSYITSAILYVCYNFVTAVKVLIEIRDSVTSRFVARASGIIGGMSMGLLGLCLALPLIQSYSEVKGMDLPLYAIVSKFGPHMKWIYALILLSAIFTTAATNGFAVLKWLEKRVSTKYYRLLFTGSGILFAHVSFSYIVGQVYPVFACIGLLQIILILYRYGGLFRSRAKR